MLGCLFYVTLADTVAAFVRLFVFYETDIKGNPGHQKLKICGIHSRLQQGPESDSRREILSTFRKKLSTRGVFVIRRKRREKHCSNYVIGCDVKSIPN